MYAAETVSNGVSGGEQSHKVQIEEGISEEVSQKVSNLENSSRLGCYFTLNNMKFAF